MVIKGNYYEIFGISPESSGEEIQGKYRELSLKHHSDKGGDSDDFKKIANAYGILVNPHERLKYDLCLLKNSTDFGEYIESEKWETTYHPNQIVSNELSLKIVSLLLKEIFDSGLTQEDLSNYGLIKRNPSSRVVRKKSSSSEVEEVLPFCQNKVKNQTFQEAINNVRKYLEVIGDTCFDKEIVEKTIEEEIMPNEELSIIPLLTREELDDYEGHNEYNSYYEKVREEILRRISANDRKSKILDRKGEFKKVVESLENKVEQRREKKKRIVERINWMVE